MRSLLTLSLALLAQSTLFAQQAPDHHFWQDKPALHKLDGKWASEPAVILADDRALDQRDNDKGDLVMFKTMHRIIQVNNDKGIESFNKFYLPGGDEVKTVSFKARAILPGGKVVDVDPASLKDITDEDGEYRIFAVPGLVQGSEIEYEYVFLRGSSLFGTEVLQMRVPVLRSDWSLSAPDRLTFEGKAFNGQPAAVDTATRDGVRTMSYRFTDIVAAEEEKYASHDANVTRLEYKLSYNSAKSVGVRLFTWNELARRMYANYSDITDKDRKKAADLAGQLKLSSMAGTREKVIALEHYLKANINVRKDLADGQGEQIDAILKTKMANETGIMQLYSAVLQEVGVPFQFVLIGDRGKYELDKNFENWNNAETGLIFFPETGKYIAPTRPELRYPWISPEWCATLGMHVKVTELGTVKSALAVMAKPPLEDYKMSCSNMEVRLVPVPQKDSLLAEVKQIYGGYTAIPYRAAFNFAGAEDQRQFIKELVKFGTNSEHILSSNVENKSWESFNDSKPFILNATVRANELMEKAGNKILLKVGEVIGPQVEMYQEKPRVFPADIAYPHVLNRTIRIVVPEGYRIKNPEALNINQLHPASGEPDMRFTSSFAYEGRDLVITVIEEYRKVRYPVSEFEEFRKVINASADFNKVVLLMEPEK